ncbi:hypothetical protein N7468_000146 [Penicillium chermesinum]|uniref:DUF6699 domain-containing protein n=1 Tax=Penicillium chermesinum TaxID=63820 RepID=A0A9W9PLS1_9EURO|nr:uncharacterized protein N7468_000146 [Penicillium chermesinum]KAJ5248695.1 hypothetical protein N7468_000146 [Penicillium chermesinum]
MSVPLTKVDSAIAGLSLEEKHEKPPAQEVESKTAKKEKPSKRGSISSDKRSSISSDKRGSTAEGVYNIKELVEEKKIELTLPIETQKTGWYVLQLTPSVLLGSPLIFPGHVLVRQRLITSSRRLNTSPNTIEDKDILKLQLIDPPVKKIDLHFPLGLEVTARNSKGVTIKDALDAIYKQFKKKADDELEAPYLAGFEWDKDECWTRLIVHQTKHNTAPHSSQPTGKKNKKKNKEENA